MQAFAQIFAAISAIFTAVESLGNTVGNIAKITEEATGEMLDQQRAERALANAKRMQAAE